MGITMTATGAFRETGASFFFIPKGALTHHWPQASGGIPPFGRAVRSARRIALSAESARQCRRACGRWSSLPVRLADRSSPSLQLRRKLLSSVGTACHPPAKTCHWQLCRSYDRRLKRRSFSFVCGKRNKTAPYGGRKEVKDYGNLSPGSKGGKPRGGAIRL